MTRLIFRAVNAWERWRHARRIRRTYPQVALLAEIEAAARRKHRASRDIAKAKRALVHDNLRREIAR